MSDAKRARLLDQLDRAALELPQMVDELTLDHLDRIARATTRLEAWLLEEVAKRERAIDKERAVSRAKLIALDRERDG